VTAPGWRRHWAKAAAWRSASTNRRIFGAAVVVGLMTVVVRGMGMLKELLVAWRFGRSDDLEAFLLAFVVPSMAVSVIAGTLGPSLIPTFVRVRDTRGPEAAAALYVRVATWSAGLLLVATALMVVGAPLYVPHLGRGFGPEKIALATRLVYVMAPLVLFSGMAGVAGAILNANERFALPALGPVLPALGAGLGVLVSGGTRDAYPMAFGLVAGHLVEAVVLVGWLARSGLHLRLARPTLDPDSRFVLSQYLPMVGGSLLMVNTQIVDQAMAAMLPAGSLSALSYGTKIMAVPLNIAVTALGTALVPYLSVLVARHDWGALRHTVAKYLRLSLGAALLPVIVFTYWAEPLVRLFFERGAFGPEDTRVVAGVQALASLQIPFFLAGILVVRTISSLSANQILIWGNVLNLTVNVALNLLFMRSLGVAGIALSTSVMYLVSLAFLYAGYSRTVGRLQGEGGR
jgi:putative peptidoglycan lipid II flippase